MENSALEHRIQALCDCLSKNDHKGETREMMAAVELYRELPASKMYEDMVLAQATLFGGKVDQIRGGIDKGMPEMSDADKANFLASGMREGLLHFIRLPNDIVLKQIYRTIASFDRNINHTWECLFSAATYHMSKSAIAPASTRSVLWVDFTEDDRHLDGSVDLDKPTDDEDGPLPPLQNGPKFS